MFFCLYTRNSSVSLQIYSGIKAICHGDIPQTAFDVSVADNATRHKRADGNRGFNRSGVASLLITPTR